MPTKESFDIDGLMVFRSDLTAVDQDGNVVPSVTTPDKYVPSLKEPLSGEQIGRYTNTTAYWREHSTYVPLKGEVIIYSDGGSTTEGGATVYIPKIKIGDGTTTVGNLPFTDSDTQQGIAGTLNTTNTTAQTPVASESLSGNVNLHKVSKTGSYDDLNNKPTIPTVNDAKLTIQKNSTTIDTFSANSDTDKTIDIKVPTNAADVSALPSSTKYAASLYLSVNSSTYVVTVQLKDQDGNNIGAAQTIDLPLESVVVSGSYNAQTKKVVLTLQNGSTIEFSVADLVEGLQIEITAQNPLSADLIVDGTTNKVFTLTMKTKLDGIEAGAEVNVQSDWNQSDNTQDDYIKNKPTIPTLRTMNHEQLTDSTLGDINIHDGFYFPNAVQDYDGNWYGAVVIGDQVWLGENLRTTHYPDGEALSYRPTNTSTKGYFYPNDSADNVAQYGLLYNIPGALNGAESSDAIPSGIQGVSPNGWHIPSKGELNKLFTYIGNQTRFIYDNDSSKIAKSISSTFGWNSSNYEYAPGNVQINNNKTGLNLVPAGYFRGGSPSNLLPMFFGEQCHLVDTTYSSSLANEKYIRYNYATVNQINNITSYGYSVRCVSDLTPIQFRNWYIKQYGSLQHHLPQEIPAQEQSDWNETDNTDPAYIKNKPNLATVATSGSYNDLSNRPTIPDSTSDLTNDSGFITLNDVPTEVVWFTFSLSGSTYSSSIPPSQILTYLEINDKCVLGLYPNSKDTTKKDVYHCMNHTHDTAKNKYSLLFATAKERTLTYFLYDSTVGSWEQYEYPMQEYLIGSGAGQNIKTINGNSLPGSGNITIHEGDDNVQSDWNQTDSSADDYIKNKPTIPAAQVNSDWNASSGVAKILNKPDLASYVSGPSVATEDNITVYDGTTGKLVKDADISVIRLYENVEYLDNTTSNPYYIARMTGKWAGSTSNAHRILDLTNIRKVIITARSNREAQYTFLKSYTEPDSEDVGETPDYANGYTTAVQIAAGTTQSLTVPADANYLYILVSTSYTYTPTSLKITGIGITEHSGTGSGFVKDDGSVDSTSYEPALPSKTNNENKVLAVGNDGTSLVWVKPVTIYSGTSDPSSSVGSDGDIYIKTTA